MKYAALTLLLAAPFAVGSGFVWVNPADTFRKELFYPEIRYEGPLLRHIYTHDGKVRWVQKFNDDKRIWEFSHIDWIQPEALPMDYDYLELKHAPSDGQEGLGQGKKGLSPYKYDEDGKKRPWWHEPIVDPINNPWR